MWLCFKLLGYRCCYCSFSILFVILFHLSLTSVRLLLCLWWLLFIVDLLCSLYRWKLYEFASIPRNATSQTKTTTKTYWTNALGVGFNYCFPICDACACHLFSFHSLFRLFILNIASFFFVLTVLDVFVLNKCIHIIQMEIFLAVLLLSLPTKTNFKDGGRWK